MATRLTDIVKVFSDKWTYGAVEFGYESDINKDHDRLYPALIIEPPTSSIPNINNGREEYSFELNFYNLFNTDAQNTVELQKRWDNLQDLANEWLDMVLKNYQDVTVQAYIDEDGIDIERVKEVGNDRLVQLKVSFTMSGFTKCFRPVSKYPTDISGLLIWYKAQSGAIFDIPTQRVDSLADQTPNSVEIVSQLADSQKPLRYGYDGVNEKTYIKFDGVNDKLTSVGTSPIGTDMTTFIVAKADETDRGTYFGYRDGTAMFRFGYNSNRIYGNISDSGGNGVELSLPNTDVSKYHISMFRFHNKRLDIEYDALGNSQSGTLNNPHYDHEQTFDGSRYDIGFIDSGVSADYFEGNFVELITFNRKLEDAEIASIKKYLNNKYNIY